MRTCRSDKVGKETPALPELESLCTSGSFVSREIYTILDSSSVSEKFTSSCSLLCLSRDHVSPTLDYTAGTRIGETPSRLIVAQSITYLQKSRLSTDFYNSFHFSTDLSSTIFLFCCSFFHSESFVKHGQLLMLIDNDK